MNDTIVAISTPLGIGGIGIIRVSGPEAFEKVGKIVKLKKGRHLSELETHKLSYCHIVEPQTGQLLDEAMVVIMRAPKSFTGEDVVEIHTHGSNIVLRKIVRVLLDLGLRYAGPGEFTKRAFLNGRIDLSQAEAIAELINAKSEFVSKMAASKLIGTLSSEIEKIKLRILDIISLIETDIEFSEDVEYVDYKKIVDEVDGVIKEMNRLLRNSELYDVFTEGVRIAIVGPPNVGKSSLLNIIAQREKAIVTEIPGTTRDIIEHQMNLEGIPAVFFDTAGIRESDDIVESLGVKRTEEAIELSDVVVILVDVSREFNKDEYRFYKNIPGNKIVLLTLNKIDLNPNYDISKYREYFGRDIEIATISCKTGENFDEFIKKLKEDILTTDVEMRDGDFILNERQSDSLRKAKRAMEGFKQDLSRGEYPEVLAVSVREALFYLDEILGKNIDDRILENIFSNFCIGK